MKNLLPRYSSFQIDDGQRVRRFSAGGTLKSWLAAAAENMSHAIFSFLVEWVGRGG